MFIGEAPGFTEDLSGLPFTGQSGRLLDEWIRELLNSVYKQHKKELFYGIANVVGCIPLDEENGIRVPTNVEAKACAPRLEQIATAVEPKAICILGKVAKKYHKIQKTLADLPTLELQHPSYILRQGGTDSIQYKKNLMYLFDFVHSTLYGSEYHG